MIICIITIFLYIYFFRDTCEIFDSLGTSSEFVSKLPKFSNSVEFNTTQLQSASSDKCGQFCAAFALLRIFNLDISFSDCINGFFSGDCEENETKVIDFLE